MKTIKIDKNYRIECDTYNYTLIQKEETEELNVKTNKKKTIKNQWYYPTLKDALNKYKEQSLKTCNSLEQVLTKLEQIDNKIQTIR